MNRDDQTKQTQMMYQQPIPPPIPKNAKKQQSRIGIAVVIVLITLILTVGGALGVYVLGTKSVQGGSVVDGNSAEIKEDASIADIVEKVSPSVVSIVTSGSSQSLFGTQQTRGAGTGIILSKDGYVLTNKHVISGAQKISVVTAEGDIYESVELIGSDPLNDLAYLKVKGVDNLTPATLGDSSTTRIGQSVIAIGNALGQYQNTVSSGIISGKGRAVSASDESGENSESLTDMIQTDTAINSGNSGGPLINYAGQVIGVNTAVASNAEGIGFSIPVNAAKGSIKQILAGKKISKAYLGIRYVDITPEAALQYSLSVKKGAYIATKDGGVESGSPADKAGLKVGDIITKIDNVSLGQNGSLSSILGQHVPGDIINLTVVRDKKEVQIKVTLGEYIE